MSVGVCCRFTFLEVHEGASAEIEAIRGAKVRQLENQQQLTDYILEEYDVKHTTEQFYKETL